MSFGDQDVPTTKIFVGGLATSTTAEMLRAYFSWYGPVQDVVLMMDKSTNRSRGFAFVHFFTCDPPERAFADYKAHQLDGRWVDVRKAVPEEKMRASTLLSEDQPARRSFSPHAGSRSVREALLAARAAAGSQSRSRSRSRKGNTKNKKKKKKKGKKKQSSSSSDSSTDGSNSSEKKKEKKKRKRKGKKGSSSSSRSQSSGSARSVSSSSVRVTGETAGSLSAGAAAGAAAGSPEVEQAKSEALKRLMALKGVEPREARMSAWRALLRQWHPDKNPDRVEVATAVFQFLQKGKRVVDPQQT